MATLVRIFVAVLSVLATLTSADATTVFSDDDAKAFFEQQWNGSVLTSPLGDFNAPSTTSATGAPRTLTAGELQIVTALSKAGFLAMAQHQQKDQTVLTVSVTPAGAAINRAGSKDQFSIPLGQFTIDQIIKNEAYTNLVDEYRVIMVTATVSWSKPYLQYVSQFEGVSLLTARKAILLIRFDPFTGKWVYVVGDFANAAEPFTTGLVMNAVRQLR